MRAFICTVLVVNALAAVCHLVNLAERKTTATTAFASVFALAIEFWLIAWGVVLLFGS